mmetsp:Transcript_18051/g.34229  ORF Transcript_18051/g.34229 Transcript_18051/m.34229 type:complete len:322 (-) Transcript_18051:102-1067(-)|eukprot:CAMPEP_0170168410 /NCGR_PEP_ID=MMETSP0040_2-20121228/1465_1 /TAXON_ID=641309 /ORGANISM="Lotharella oceanica, Strain CCMP622" /LENGTH=321 /DNA_ID=CAMNT_0010406657 /DNA_START=120 /DNA_END=1085 /DNA_ORIENTATION=+
MNGLSAIRMARQIVGASKAKHNIVLLHGLLSSKRGWGSFPTRLLKALAETTAEEPDFRIHMVDCRNHGDSEHTSFHSLEAVAEDIKHYLVENEISSPILMGHSMGGKAALLYATLYGTEHSPYGDGPGVQSVVALDAAPCVYDTNHKYIFDAMQSIDLSTVRTRAEVDKHLKAHISYAAERAFVMANLRTDADKKVKWIPNLPVLARDEKHVHDWPSFGSKPFHGPALFVGGNLSTRLTTERHLKAVRNLCPRSTVVMVQGGHFVHHAACEDTVDHIVDFLSLELRLRRKDDPYRDQHGFFKRMKGQSPVFPSEIHADMYR